MCLACEMSALWFAQMEEAARRGDAAQGRPSADESATIDGTRRDRAIPSAAGESLADSVASAQRLNCEPTGRG
jgi:hypothetical protein